MSHTFLSLYEHQFDVRLALGGCLININGETRDCTVAIDKTRRDSPTYTVLDPSREVLCTFRQYHLHGGPLMYQIEGVSQSYGDACLVVPTHDLLTEEI